MRGEKIYSYISLIGAFFIYSLSSVFAKGASLQAPLSFGYVGLLTCAIVVLGLYAVIWQQIIKRMCVSDAFMFKGMTIIFVMLLSYLIFGEIITLSNCVGAIIIIVGIALYAKS
jgi:drug/metabolite transporter (DMT)-like permease